ncbi:hypothetical protein TNCV_98511 [Trichonephila clavipes]|nr:hypothetical protein TNCV_98511 [Trichonephila clavipes]
MCKTPIDHWVDQEDGAIAVNVQSRDQLLSLVPVDGHMESREEKFQPGSRSLWARWCSKWCEDGATDSVMDVSNCRTYRDLDGRAGPLQMEM